MIRQSFSGWLIPVLLLLPFTRTKAQTPPFEVRHISRLTTGIHSPLRLAVNSRDEVYVAEAACGRISRFDADGVALGDLLINHSPLALAFAPEGSLYVGDRRTGRLSLFSADGEFLKTIAKDSASFLLPASAAMDDENNLYVADGKRKRVRVFDASGKELPSIGESIVSFPTSVAYDRKNKRILVGEHGGVDWGYSPPGEYMIHVFDKAGTRLFGVGRFGFRFGAFVRVQGLAVDDHGRIYVADPFVGAVTILDEHGEFLQSAGSFGEASGQLRLPMDVAIDSRNRIWVASTNNHSLELFEIVEGENPTDVAEPNSTSPHYSALLQNYPNPFNPGTWIPFVLEKDSPVTIQVYDELGRRIRSFDIGMRRAGEYRVPGRSVYWDGTNEHRRTVANGVYFYEIRAGSFFAVRRMILIR